MKTITLAAAILFFASCSQEDKQQAASDVTTVSIAIPTAQCSMCENKIVKALKNTEGVQSATVDLEAKTVSVVFTEASLTLNDLETAISKTGYDANEMKADQGAYEGLAACCKLPEEKEEEAVKPMDSM